MNIILIRPEETNGTNATIKGDRFKHIKEVLKGKMGTVIRTGLLGGQMGTSVIIGINSYSVMLKMNHTEEPPEPSGVTVILALPRPKVYRRIVFGMVCAGVKDIHIINTWRVDKSYWDSPYLEKARLNEYFFDALQQAKDTMMPRLTYHRFFNDFINDALPSLPAENRYFAHPYDSSETEFSTPAVVAIGCEGGFIEKEADSFIRNGFKPFSLGERILTTEYAVPYVLGMMK